MAQPRSPRSFTRVAAAALALSLAGAACRPGARPAPVPVPPARPIPSTAVPLRTQPPLATLAAHRVVPAPASVTPGAGAAFALTAATVVAVPAAAGGPALGNSAPGGSALGDTAAAAAREAARVGDALARLLRPPTGYRIPVVAAGVAVPRGAVVLRLGGPAEFGAEGYQVTVTADSVQLLAAAPAGLFYAAQTLRQLLPAGVEADQSPIRAASAWTVPPGRVADRPRFAHRGGMLDVARHFFPADEVEQYVDLLALYKLNVLHLHLTDDQGWRVQIDARPRLTTVGAASEVSGRSGGFYTKADYARIVRYAADRFITVVPEVDMPAHTQAAIAAYPELGCGRAAPDTSLNAPLPGLYTGIRVGWSALCPDKEETYRFVDDVVGELAAMTPGPYLHVGGDEVSALSRAQYAAFMERVQGIVRRHGKTPVGWDEIGRARLLPGTVAQMWRSDTAMLAARQGARLVISPATKAYLDMKYTPATELGHRWAAFIELRTAYDWDPASHFPGVREADVLGVEAPLWTETVRNFTAASYLLLPRLPAVAELAWSPAAAHSWPSFRARIAGHAPRWRLLGLNFYPSPQVDWEPVEPGARAR